MFRNRILTNGSAYLAKTLFTDIRPLDKKPAQFKVVCTRLLVFSWVSDARASTKLDFKLLYFEKLGKKFY